MFTPKSKNTKLRKLITNECGATAITFSLASVALIGAAGLAIDFGRLHLERSKLQEMLDASLIAGASISAQLPNQIAEAKRYFAANSQTSAQPLTVEFFPDRSQIAGKVSTTMKSSLLAVVGIQEFDVVVNGKATNSVGYEPMCFTAMHPTRKHTLELNDSVSIVAPECNIYGNSSHFNDVVDPHSSQNFITARSVAARGGGHNFLENVTPPVQFGIELISLPLPNVIVPPTPACLATDKVISGQTMVLPAGHYCGGLTIEVGSKVTLEDGGKYFISGGPLEIKQSALQGKNIALIMKDTRSKFIVEGSKVTLAAQKTGPLAGVAVYGLSATNGNLIDDAQMDIHGVFFLPNADFVWNNVSDFTPTSAWGSYVVDGVSWTGTGTVRYNFDLSASDIPFPSSMRAVPMVSDIRLVQ